MNKRIFLRDTDISVRCLNALKALDIDYIDELPAYSAHDLWTLPYVSRKSIKEIRELLASHNLKLKGE